MENTPFPDNEWDAQFYRPAESFFTQNREVCLTYDDVSLATNFSSVLPRETHLETRLSDRLLLQTPIISADMDTVTEAPMAIGMALNGGMGLIHYNMSEKEQLREVARVKNHVHGLIQDPITVSPEKCVGDVLELIERKGYNFHTFPVVDGSGEFLGLLLGRVVKERYRSKTVREAMTPRKEIYSISVNDLGNDPIGAADRFFNDHMGIHKLIVLTEDNRLHGLFTLTDIERINSERASAVKPARDAEFRLVCGAALSAPRDNAGQLDRDRFLAHAHNLVTEGVDALAISTAHGHSAGVGHLLRLLRETFADRVTLIAGNVTSAAGVAFLAEAGADAIKVGQGPGSICTTRVVAGVGIPQLTALYVAGREAARCGVRILADGGITKSGDIVKALTLADAVICGGLLAGCREAPGQLIEIEGKLYKQYRGMGSLEAMKAGSAARYGHADTHSSTRIVSARSGVSRTDKIAPEGIEALKELAGSLDDILTPLTGGIRSGMGYLGARTLSELKSRARYVRVSPAGMKEAAPHDVIEVKQSKS